VVDPGDAAYRAFLLEQLVRHIVYEDAFAGIVIDRSDWMNQFNLRADDNLTFLPELAAVNSSWGIVRSLRVTYAAMISDLRATLTATVASRRADSASASASASPLGSGIMLMNTYGNCRLDMLRHYDGQFSEGRAVNAVGLLGARSPAVLWTYNSQECCGSPAATASYLQHHLYVGVAPMAPFPGNDHAISWDAGIAAQYGRYGALFGALRGRVWALHAHLVSLGSGPDGLKVNAFEVPAEPKQGSVALLLAVMLGGSSATGMASVNVTRWDRVWGLGGQAETFSLELLAPGVGAASGWEPLPGLPSLACGSSSAACSAVLPVQLVEGCAMVRIRLG